MISVRQLHKTYHRGEEAIHALRGIDLEIEKGEFVVILGPSGGGKSTLLNMLGGIDRPTSGAVTINGFELEKASEEALTLFRRDHVGFIFQFYNLISALNAVENASLPLMARGLAYKQARQRAAAILQRVGLEQRLEHLPAELSGGEQQRVAIARSIICEPDLVLADEPTGDLDSVSAHEVTSLMHELNAELGITFVVATHNLALTEKASRVFELLDGQLHQKTNGKD
ncbi:MAG TPA: ABC transporter ATP-binding protein [Anaerolineaceae bacterium]|nr:ABC transporter ATP-binding protein [Anaerolineaceae bacterium]